MKIIRLSDVRTCTNGRVSRKVLVGDERSLPTVVTEYAKDVESLPERTVGDDVVVAMRPYLTDDGRQGSAIEIVDF